MNKPHIDKLHYRMIFHDSVDYKKASPVTDENKIFKITASDSRVIFDIKQHYDSVKDVRKITDEYLRQWEIIIGLTAAPGEITFKFEHADIIDLAPDRDSSMIHLLASSTKIVSNTGKSTAHISRDKYPKPPSGFFVSPDVESMFLRFKAYHEGRDKLLSMASLVLTIFEMNAGTRVKAAEKFNVSKTILDKLGTLCESGGQGDGHIRSEGHSFVPLTGIDNAWVLAACKLIIQRTGECEKSGSEGLPKLTMDDLPLLR